MSAACAARRRTAPATTATLERDVAAPADRRSNIRWQRARFPRRKFAAPVARALAVAVLPANAAGDFPSALPRLAGLSRRGRAESLPVAAKRVRPVWR